MAKKVAYIYVFTLSVGGKPIARYAGKHESKDSKFDVSYLGSGTCWEWLRNEFGFKQGNLWQWNKNKKQYEFIGKHCAVFTGNVACVMTDETPDYFEESVIEAMVQSEGLNMELIEKYRSEHTSKEASSAVDEFLKLHKDICGGKGLFVNQVKGGTLSAQLAQAERRDRVQGSMLQFLKNDSDKVDFENGKLGMDSKAVFVYKNGQEKELKLTHVFGTACVSLGYAYTELKTKLSPEYFDKYEISKKRLLVQKVVRDVIKNCRNLPNYIDKKILSNELRNYLLNQMDSVDYENACKDREKYKAGLQKYLNAKINQ